MYLGPLTFDEIYKAKPWGGRALARIAGKRLPPNDPIGESWELADHPHGASVVNSGPLAGTSLRDLMRHHSRELMGRKASGRRFPLLIKTIDARDRLSVQVHPDDRLARALKLTDTGKTEAWVILHVSKQGQLISGLKSARVIPQLGALAQSGNLAHHLKIMHPQKGDVLLCKAGAVHASGPGVVFLEIQQNSDATFRLYDWGRMGLDGKPRSLHINEALRAIGKQALSVVRPRPRTLNGLPFPATRKTSCEKFVIDEWQVNRPAERAKSNRFEILHILNGHGRLNDGQWPGIRLRRGRTVLIPACTASYTIRPVAPITFIRAALPE